MSAVGSGSRAVHVAIAGIHGHGAHHARLIATSDQLQDCEVVAFIDPKPLDATAEVCQLWPAAVQYASLEAMLASATPADVVIIATPIPTHLAMAKACLNVGIDVLLEKPPTTSLSEYEDLRASAAVSEGLCQMGFQSFGSHALSAVQEMMRTGYLGTIRGIGGVGVWQRDAAYYDRAAWAGRRRLNGADVVDGVITNPLAHAVATGLQLAQAFEPESLEFVHLEQFHAHKIEADDTSTIVMRANGTRLAFGLTLCASRSKEPRLLVHGSERTAVFFYTQDRVQVWHGGVNDGVCESDRQYGRQELLANLVQVRRGEATQLTAAVESVGGFMRVMEAVRVAPEVRTVPPEVVVWHGSEGTARPEILGVDALMEAVATQLGSLQSLNVAWALPEGADLGAQGAVSHRSELGIETIQSPRPYLHPVRTPAGTIVTATMPGDHDWHLGMGLAMQDVAGVNIWGGRTCTASEGYVWLADHGRVDTLSLDRAEPVWSYDLMWRGPVSGTTVQDLLRERRVIEVQSDASVTEVTWSSALFPAGAEALSLGSPATDGRPGAGYGGFFMRLAKCSHVNVQAGDGSTVKFEGESDCMGARSEWLRFSALSESGERFSVTLNHDPSDGLPWFVRAHDYPGVGLCLAYEERRTVAEAGLSMNLTVRVTDGP